MLNNEPEYLIIELNNSLKLELQSLVTAEYAKSYKDAVIKSISLTYASMGNRLAEAPSLTSKNPISAEKNENLKSTEIKLSRRQKQLIPLLNQGLANNEISNILGISEHTVKVHLWRLYKKLNTQNRTETLYISRLKGWLL